MKIAQVIDLPVDQYVTRSDHSPDALAGLGQTSSKLSTADIKKVQQALITLGYPLQGGADGTVGRTVKMAVAFVIPKVEAARKAAAVKAGRSWKKLDVPDNVPNFDFYAALFERPDMGGSDPLSPNPQFAASASEKSAVKAASAPPRSRSATAPTSSTRGGSVTTGGGGTGSTTGGGTRSTGGGTIVGSDGVKDPMADGGGATNYGFMQPYADWLKTQTYLPAPLQNPYVAAGAVVVVGGLLIYGIYRATRSSPAAVMAGVGEMDALDAMKQAMRPAPKKKRKSRRKSRKAKK